jgi:predicted small metal-binding protein
MAKKLHCRDLGMNCDFEATGNTDEEILRQASAHARSAHQINDVTPELAAKVKAAIRTV